MSEKELNFKDRELSGIQRFFIICSGADRSIIEDCPTEWNKYTGIGATIFFTGLLACLSGGYALYTIFRNTNLEGIDRMALLGALFFGLIWGAVIFNLDRFIVSTFHKTNKGGFWKRLGREFLQALPRILLAVIIAIVISKPIEIKIFESRLAEQIQQNEIDARKRNQSSFSEINNISNKTQDITAKEKKDSTLQQELADDPQVVKKLINNDLATAKSELATTQQLNNPKIENHNQMIRNIRSYQSNYRPALDAGGNTVSNNNGSIKQNLTEEANSNIRNHNGEIGRLRAEINTKQKEVDLINGRIAKERGRYIEQKQEEIIRNKDALSTARATLDTTIVKVNEETTGADQITKKAFTNNFITQIEALGDLTNNDSTMWWTSLMITLLFLTIELAPILTKLITKRGAYDEKLDRVEYENLVEQQSIISQINSKINEHLKKAEEAAQLSGDIMIQKQKAKLDIELTNNKIILDTIAKYQQELALEAIEKWYKEQKAKIK